MDSALAWHRFLFAFTITYHYLFPQLTMGLALLIFVLKTMALRTGNAHYDQAARFWTRIFAINFAMGVVTGIPMEFQFGTDWSRFSKYAGGVIGQSLAMEGVFSFFLESAFLGVLLYGEKRVSPRVHWFASLAVFVGSWLSGWFIIVTDAWMQHPVAFRQPVAGGPVELESWWGLMLNPWAFWQYLHNMMGSVVTASFAMAGLGAFYALSRRHAKFAGTFLRTGVIAGAAASVLLLFPTGDQQGANLATYQPATLAAMEGLFETEHGAGIALIGQPDTDKMHLDNPIVVPRMLSFLTYRYWDARVSGLKEFPRDTWPDNIPLLYFSYHIMVGLGTVFVAGMAVAVWALWRGGLERWHAVQWMLMLLVPFPYIANTAGWMTAELGRQPWLVYGLLRTAQGSSPQVSSGNTVFTLLGFLGMYTILGLLLVMLLYREIEHGPDDPHEGFANTMREGARRAA